MGTKHVLCVVAGGLAIAGAVSTTQAAWLAPTGGWQVDYEASGGKTPDAATPAWTNSNYQSADPNAANYSAIVTDNITSDPALYLKNTDNPLYILDSGYGAGTANDKITMDFGFRIMDGTKGSTDEQFAVSLGRPNGGSTVTLNFSLGGVHDADSGATATNLALGTSWHEARLLVDVHALTASLYLDGQATPALSWTTTVNQFNGNQVWFGDGQGAVSGLAEISYFRFTNNELAAVPEPTSLALFGLSGLLALRRRRRS